MAKKPAASQIGVPRCISQVAAVCLRVCGVTPSSPARPHAAAKPFLMSRIRLPLRWSTYPKSVPRFRVAPNRSFHSGSHPRECYNRGHPHIHSSDRTPHRVSAVEELGTGRPSHLALAHAPSRSLALLTKTRRRLEQQTLPLGQAVSEFGAFAHRDH
jgi:hypothetical protein